MPKNSEGQYRYTQNRELSWLRFDRRVLEEAADPGVPALERLKFVSIFSSNLDEFFMVRVGSLFDLAHMTPDDTDSKTGWIPAQQLHHIYRAIPGLLTMKQQIYTAVMETLAKYGIQDAPIETLDAGELKQINRFFKPVLQNRAAAGSVSHRDCAKPSGAASGQQKALCRRAAGKQKGAQSCWHCAGSGQCAAVSAACGWKTLCTHGKHSSALAADTVRRLHGEGDLHSRRNAQRRHQL